MLNSEYIVKRRAEIKSALDQLSGALQMLDELLELETGDGASAPPSSDIPVKEDE